MRKRSRAFDAEVGQFIRHHRKSTKLSLQGLADRLGITYQQVQKYELGVNRISVGRLVEIAEILNVPVAHFFGNGGNGANGGSTETNITPALQGRQLLISFLRIKDPTERGLVLDYVRALAEPE
jgi:transcriptional regulator with XRE-family HTH domain